MGITEERHIIQLDRKSRSSVQNIKIGYIHKALKIIVDHYSKFSYNRKLSTTTSVMVAEQTKQILSESGIPQRVISDNGPRFTGEAYKQCVCIWN